MELTTVQISAGKIFTKEIKCDTETLIGWYFKTGPHDISFQCTFYSEDGKEEIVMPPSRVNAFELPIQGSYTSTSTGTLKIIWSNSFSYFRGKEISYCVTVSECANDGIQVVGHDVNVLDKQNVGHETD
jgi:hypothetical protein